MSSSLTQKPNTTKRSPYYHNIVQRTLQHVESAPKALKYITPEIMCIAR
ncbi:hypothetical protein M7I_6800 [Glarea lozoyensis 74030]|uniref:Uncharacterized protein n=1 Tax=Glarea lozoyensis (strain ATCC 74030 / MF5533) TaxID=1104152 RepID=H0EVK2_GLAL7|nr:hypothetical protein M7I_6800 [Glarea lozoyensis 74030]